MASHADVLLARHAILPSERLSASESSPRLFRVRFFFSHDVDSTGPPSLPTVTESLKELLPTSLQSRMRGKVHVVHNHNALFS